ncbi:MAG: hypothetical protein KJZ54_01315 [Phycisphaerales bacterium]|nr:hypothetical protein [Phycisphaerales bacterium]
MPTLLTAAIAVVAASALAAAGQPEATVIVGKGRILEPHERTPTLEPLAALASAPVYGGEPVAGRSVRLRDGRIVVAFSDPDAHAGGRFNRGLPCAALTDDGEDWRPEAALWPSRIADTSLLRSAWAAPMTTAARAFSDLAARREPAIAADPRTEDVFVAFTAARATAPENADVAIARSTDRGESFQPHVPDGLMLLTDSLLGLSPGTHGPDQFVPAIAIDACGGVNLMFYDSRHDGNLGDGEEWVDVYYARITGFGTANPIVQQWRLTPQSFRVDNLASGFLGDYHNLTVSADGNSLYAAYIARDMADPENGARTCYLHRININCIGFLLDFNGDGTVDEEDTTHFLAAFDAKASEADLNLDWAVDAQDLTLFLAWYADESAE